MGRVRSVCEQLPPEAPSVSRTASHVRLFSPGAELALRELVRIRLLGFSRGFSIGDLTLTETREFGRSRGQFHGTHVFCQVILACALPSSYVSLCDNEKTGCKARELKSVYVDAVGQFLKLIFHENHVNKYNIYNQVRRALPTSSQHHRAPRPWQRHFESCFKMVTLMGGRELSGSHAVGSGAAAPRQVHAGHLPTQVRWAAQAGCPLELRGVVGGEESVMR